MAEERPPVPEGDRLVECPGGCGTMVQQKNAGQSHSYFERAGGNRRVVCSGR